MNILYMMDGCTRCHKAKKYLEAKGTPFTEINILEEPHTASTLMELIGEVYTPVFVTDKKILKGDEILEYEKEAT
ncbi:glutaredoxin family protein [Pontibacillus yanchengensis]|uniref:Glutaredoxin domain-containing protein n=1 Tax=Pontibacillus yanchengensis Y32 TaxID=1385514 RepID=A0A0A2TBF8_9BACI|nr:glutaredoxin domain-containing protein [Pontibacillus yanchengensis]KGP71763.1 hypothetical protein N782_16570 [Pontibacillus yanchengensis Y32]